MDGRVSDRRAFLVSVPVGEASEQVEGLQRDLGEIVSAITKRHFQGLVVAFDLEGKILYANDRVRFLTGIEERSPVEQVFFEHIPRKERASVIQMFYRVYRARESIKKTNCSVPLVVGPYEVGHEGVKGELMTFSEGLVLKIPDEVLTSVKEMELEKLKLLLLKHPHTGLWVTDEGGAIVDIVKSNCELNLGWDDQEVLGKNISVVIEGGRSPDHSCATYFLNRMQKNGPPKKTEVVEDKITLSNGKVYYIYLDTYFWSVVYLSE